MAKLNRITLAVLWRIVRHPICVLGLALLALLWAAIGVQMSNEYSDAIRSAIERGESTARLLAKDTVRLFKQADAKLLVLREAYERDPQHFNFDATAEPLGVISESTINLAFINSDGYLISRTHLPLPTSGRLFVGDAEHFQAQIQPARDELYIALPLTLRSAGLPAVQVSRRLRKPDGSFAGIISATLDPDFVKQFAQAFGTKAVNTVSVRRMDGKLIASFGYTTADSRQGALNEALVRAPSGHVLSHGLRADGGRRLLTYQTLTELPLIITVGELESQILSAYYSHRTVYLTSAVVLSLMVLMFGAFGLERQLDSQTAHDNLRAAFESIPHGLTMFDANGALIVSNTRYGELYHLPDKLRQRGTSFEAIYEHCVKERTVKGGLSGPDVWKQLARAKSGEHFSNRLELADGYIVSLTQSPMHNGGWVTLHEDITDKLSAENQKEYLQQRLAQSQKLEVVGQLTGGIAHDFNNLLLVIIGNLDLLKDTASPSSQELDLIETSLAAALSGSELSNSLLAFSRRQTFKIEPINIRKTVSEQIRLLKQAVGSKTVIAEKYSDEDLVITVDNAQFRSALTNLVVNARDAMPDGGTIAVSVQGYMVPENGSTEHVELAAGDYAVLEVKDTGTGMPPDVVSKIFEPFFTTKEVGKGTGLGLSMVYGFIKEMKGIIRVASKIGEGTTFSIYLPCAKPLPVVIAPSLAPSSAIATQTREQTILVVDDDDGVRKLVVNQINSLGYRVIDAATPDKALAVIESDEQVDLLFSDVVMAGPMDGLQLAQLAHERRPALKILLTTGYPDLKFERSSSDEYQQWSILKKPYRRDELKAMLKKMLEHSEQRASEDPGHRGETATTGLVLHG